MNWCNWLWRWCATAIGFLLFGIFGIVFKILLLPYILPNTRKKSASHLKARRLVGGIWAGFIHYLRFTGVISVRYQGFERLGRPGQLIMVNHPSLLDVVFMLAKVPKLNCIVKKDLLSNPIMKSPILACGFLPNDESLQIIEDADAVLKGGQSLLIFPEGTRTGWDNKICFNRGAVSIGLRSATVITPVVIVMNPPALKKNQPWYQIPKQKIQYDFYVGNDIDPQDWLQSKPLPIAARQLNQQLQEYFQQECKRESLNGRFNYTN